MLVLFFYPSYCFEHVSVLSYIGVLAGVLVLTGVVVEAGVSPNLRTMKGGGKMLLRKRVKKLRQPHQLDPKPLANLKVLLVKYNRALFTCLKLEGMPCDNNRAERGLRPLAIKRKKSFGSRTEQGAHAMEILLSAAWSTTI